MTKEKIQTFNSVWDALADTPEEAERLKTWSEMRRNNLVTKMYTLDIYQEGSQGGHYSKKIIRGLSRNKVLEKARAWLRQDKENAAWIKRWGSKGSGTPESWGTGPYGQGYSCGMYYIQISEEEID